jgi:hypothetical protein
MSRWCARLASSGTTPPNPSCTRWLETTFERSTPPATTAAAVSSQEDSMPRISARVGALGTPILVPCARLGAHQQALGHKPIGDARGRLEHPAQVAAQVHHQGRHAAFAQARDGLVELFRRAAAEGADRQVADAVAARQQPRVAHGGVDDRFGAQAQGAPLTLQVFQFQFDLAPGGGLQPLAQGAELRVVRALAVQSQDALAHPHPGRLGRAAGQRVEHPVGLAGLGENHADADEDAAGFLLELGRLARGT